MRGQLQCWQHLYCCCNLYLLHSLSLCPRAWMGLDLHMSIMRAEKVSTAIDTVLHSQGRLYRSEILQHTAGFEENDSVYCTGCVNLMTLCWQEDLACRKSCMSRPSPQTFIHKWCCCNTFHAPGKLTMPMVQTAQAGTVPSHRAGMKPHHSTTILEPATYHDTCVIPSLWVPPWGGCKAQVISAYSFVRHHLKLGAWQG